MDVYKFNKCLLDRLEESMLVLPWNDEIIKTSQVRENWASYLEFQIEPAGWQAVWNIPRVICESLNVRYPTSAFGYVEQVLFKDLRAVFLIEAVQEENANLMERHEVALEELWPTISQENNALNVERTADCLDRFRFFYAHVWMPWDDDNDDDLNWVEKHLESRIRFCYDLRKGCITRKVAQYIRSLLAEAKYLQMRREFLELDLSDDEADNERTLESSEVTELMRLHLRLSMIRNEIEILENPEMRRIYEQEHFSDSEDKTKEEQRKKCFIITKPCALSHQMELLRKAESLINQDDHVELLPILLDALNKSKPHDKIFLGPGIHRLKFLEYLNENGLMFGIVSNPKMQCINYEMSFEDQAIICSPNDDSVLLVINGDYTLENIWLDCRNVRTGILLKFGGNIILRNCRITGDGRSSTQQGIVCSGNTKLSLIDCTVERFANGIVIQNNTELLIKNSRIIDCTVGLEINEQSSKINIHNTTIARCKSYGILVNNFYKDNFEEKWIRLNTFKQLSEITNFSGNCEFQQCKNNIHVVNGNMTLVTAASLNVIRSEIHNEECENFMKPLCNQSNKVLLSED